MTEVTLRDGQQSDEALAYRVARQLEKWQEAGQNGLLDVVRQIAEYRRDGKAPVVREGSVAAAQASKIVEAGLASIQLDTVRRGSTAGQEFLAISEPVQAIVLSALQHDPATKQTSFQAPYEGYVTEQERREKALKVIEEVQKEFENDADRPDKDPVGGTRRLDGRTDKPAQSHVGRLEGESLSVAPRGYSHVERLEEVDVPSIGADNPSLGKSRGRY